MSETPTKHNPACTCGHTVNEHGHVVRGQDGRQIAYTRCRECDCRRVKVAKVGRRLDGCT